MSKLTLMSLFDGSGGFPLGACLCGMEPKYASEIEVFPVEVTRLRFPGMRHLGDVTKINGAELEPVDIVTFGSPCQDLSVAGRRAGLAGERSGLFLDLTRDGMGLGAYWATDIPSHSASSTPNTGESPRDADASTLSAILEANAPAKYFLSERACAGILARADRHGIELPKGLRDALIAQSSATKGA